MAITSLDDVAKAMKGSIILPYSKASASSMVAGSEMSHWRVAGFPITGAIPTAAEVCSSALNGALPLISRSDPEERVILGINMLMSAVGHVIQVEDRLAHMGGLNGTLLTAQTVNVDVSGGTNNLPARIGSSDFSEVRWYLDWYVATGVTVSTPTAQVTYHDDTTGSVNIWVGGGTALPASVAASRRYRIIPTNGKYIKSIQSVTLSASTGTAGNFGVTAVRPLTWHECAIANVSQLRDWSYLNLPKIADSACITLSQNCITTTSGVSLGSIVQGKA